MEKLNALLNRYPLDGNVYRRAEAKTDDTGHRIITAPNKPLNIWLKEVNKCLNDLYSVWPEHMHGGIKGRSYITYARPHIGKDCVITLDIRGCFDSISAIDVATALSEHLGIGGDASRLISERLCYQGKLAQGYATSNFICNLYLLNCLSTIKNLLESESVNFGSYVDDLAVSGTISDKATLINGVITELSRAKLSVGKAKIRVMTRSHQQEICGLLVNEGITLSKNKKAELMGLLARGEMSEASALGWMANLKSIDNAFSKKFMQYAIKKQVIVPTTA